METGAPVSLSPVGAADAQRGLLGIRYQTLPEGLLVTEVAPGMGADAAGLTPGDLIVTIDGATVRGTDAGARGRLVGEPKTKVHLSLLGPEAAELREAVVTRGGSVSRKRSGLAPVPPSVAALRRAAGDGDAQDVMRALEAAIVADFGGWSPGRSVAGSLRQLLARDVGLAMQMAARLDALVQDDPAALRQLAQVWGAGGDAEQFVVAMGRYEAARPPDVRLASGQPGEAGGEPEARSEWVSARWMLGERESALRDGRRLLETHDLPTLRAVLGMAGPAPAGLWRGDLPSQASFDAPLMDGTTWSLDATRGQVVLLTFWATWCGPCRDELPEVEALWQARREDGLVVLGVSVDEPAEGESVATAAREMGLHFPISHAPQLGQQFDVTAIPSVRLLGRDGTVRFRARGYSPDTVAQLALAVDRALVEPADGASVLGEVRGVGQARLEAWRPVSGASAVAESPGGVVVALHGAGPMQLGPDGATVGESVGGSGGGHGHVAWPTEAVSGPVPVGGVGGPVVGPTDGLWLRALDSAGEARWFRTFRSPLVTVVSSGPHIWVATQDALLVLDSAGAVRARRDRFDGGGRADELVRAAIVDLAPATAGGVWAVDGAMRSRLVVDGADIREVEVDAMPGAARVAQDGSVATDIATDLVAGPFGPDGATRVILARRDGVVIGLDGQGAPALVVRLAAPPRLAVLGGSDLGRTDGEARLALSIPGQGVALASIALP
jgi:peroxiredoxin